MNLWQFESPSSHSTCDWVFKVFFRKILKTQHNKPPPQMNTILRQTNQSLVLSSSEWNQFILPIHIIMSVTTLDIEGFLFPTYTKIAILLVWICIKPLPSCKLEIMFSLAQNIISITKLFKVFVKLYIIISLAELIQITFTD